ncbi:unnamed protein product [Diatraea saccharalis]|uniref:Uncharacterized protein n=1 Tax=Diatraea saccharalis TaxID=40085 RepID=A0A9N9WJJ8_9NEOP|nr:unnamed protein product [Diatraea saccharalis]
MSAQKYLIIASALLVQTVYSLPLNFGSILGNTGVDLELQATSTAAGGLSGYLGNGGLINSGVTNVGVNSFGFGNGVIGAGLGSDIAVIGGSNAGLVGTGLNGVALNVGGLNVGSSGPLVVTSISPIGPSGLVVASENVIEGTLLVSGSLPFLSAVAFEGGLPTAGNGVATCGCGNGAVGIINP